MNRQQHINLQRAWLAASLGVSKPDVTDEHVFAWERLASDIRSHKQSEDQARGVRAKALESGVKTRTRETAVDRHVAEVERVFGPRPLLEGEVE